MRLMVQSLLADRFKLAVHFETQVVPVLAMILAASKKRSLSAIAELMYLGHWRFSRISRIMVMTSSSITTCRSNAIQAFSQWPRKSEV